MFIDEFHKLCPWGHGNRTFTEIHIYFFGVRGQLKLLKLLRQDAEEHDITKKTGELQKEVNDIEQYCLSVRRAVCSYPS